MTSDLRTVQADIVARAILATEGCTIDDVLKHMLETASGDFYEMNPARPSTPKRVPTFDIMVVEGENWLAQGLTLIGDIALHGSERSVDGAIARPPRVRIHDHSLPESLCGAAVGMDLGIVMTLPAILSSLSGAKVTGIENVSANGGARNDLLIDVEADFKPLRGTA